MITLVNAAITETMVALDKQLGDENAALKARIAELKPALVDDRDGHDY